MSVQAFIDAFKTRLDSDSGAGGVYTLTSGRIAEGQAEINQTLPHLVFTVTQATPTDHLTGNLGYDVLIESRAYGDRHLGSKAAARTLADRMFTLLHRQSITISGFTGGQTFCLNANTTIIEEDAYAILQLWRMKNA